MFKRCKVVMLITNEKASLCISQDKLTRFYGIEPDNEILVYRHLYIISGDKIKEDDYIYDVMFKRIGKVVKDKSVYSNSIVYNDRLDCYTSNKGNCKKVIASTDNSLRIDSSIRDKSNDNYGKLISIIPRPLDSFISKYIEEYNKGNVITDVMVEYEAMNTTIINRNYSDFEPKVNYKDNTITIKKVKDSWNREELEELCLKFFNAGSMYLVTEEKVYPQSDSFEEVKKRLL